MQLKLLGGREPDNPPKQGKCVWNREYAEYELDKMLEMLEEEKKQQNFRYLFLKELFIERGYSCSFFFESAGKLKEEAWFREKFELIRDILHTRLLRLGLADPKRVSMVIWLDKALYGSHQAEPDEGRELVLIANEVVL